MSSRRMAATYVYCVVLSKRAPRVAGAPSGLPGAGPVRAVEIGSGLFAIVSDAPLASYGEAAINAKLSDLKWVSRAAVRHEAVVEHFNVDATAAGAVLPMTLFTLFADDDRLLARMRGDRSRLLALAKRVGGHEEWGVRVLLDRARAVSGSPPRGRSQTATTGRSYLSRKKAARDASLELAARAQETVAALFDRLGKKARLARRRAAAEQPADGGSLLLDAAFLVPRRKAAAFRAAAAERARALAPHGYAVTLTGPWPPYTFVQD